MDDVAVLDSHPNAGPPALTDAALKAGATAPDESSIGGSAGRETRAAPLPGHHETELVVVTAAPVRAGSWTRLRPRVVARPGSTHPAARGRLPNFIIAILAALLIAAFVISFTLGRYPISLDQLIDAFYLKITQDGASPNSTTQAVLFDVRLPRIIASILVGSALSVSGATFQGLFRNPMVSSDILGASAGAGFGAAIAILLSLGSVWTQLLSFTFGFAAVALTYAVSKVVGRGSSPILVLVLIGLVVQALFTSAISLTKYVADPDSKLPAITFWLMGGLASITMNDIKIVMIPMLLGVIPLMLVRWKLNVLSFGDEEAQSMGIDTNKIRIITIICSTLLTASTVSICGMIGWVGLVIPHLARMIVGPNYKVLLPASLLIGGIFMVGVDDVARCMFPMEIPLGILTAMIGAPFFIYLLVKGKKSWL